VTPSPRIEPGSQWWEASALIASPPMLPRKKFYCSALQDGHCVVSGQYELDLLLYSLRNAVSNNLESPHLTPIGFPGRSRKPAKESQLPDAHGGCSRWQRGRKHHRWTWRTAGSAWWAMVVCLQVDWTEVI
jgi:hypothetical protein